jgi:lactate racemase
MVGVKGMTMELPYGRGRASFELPAGWAVDVLRTNPVSPADDPGEEVARSLDRPFGGRNLEDYRGAASVAIAVSDETRLVPNRVILPILLSRLEALGFSKPQITVLIASGSHVPMPPARFSAVLPEDVAGGCRVVAHDARDPGLDYVGLTSRGTPVYINPLFFRAGLRIVVGLIDPHQFVGYTGGVKGAAIGLGGIQTITANHSLLFDPHSLVGEIENNPVRQDIEEIGKLDGVHFVINVVLDEKNRLVRAFSGDPSGVEAAGSEFCRTIYEITVADEYDVVIASPGGYPKDINVYQAQKGLLHATPVVRQGGDIILLAECQDGFGSETFHQTMKSYRTPQEVVDGIRQGPFKIGVHKAYLWARSLAKARVYLCSSLSEEFNRDLMTIPVKTVQDAVRQIEPHYARPPRIAAIPKANSTYARIGSK